MHCYRIELPNNQPFDAEPGPRRWVSRGPMPAVPPKPQRLTLDFRIAVADDIERCAAKGSVKFASPPPVVADGTHIANDDAEADTGEPRTEEIPATPGKKSLTGHHPPRTAPPALSERMAK